MNAKRFCAPVASIQLALWSRPLENCSLVPVYWFPHLPPVITAIAAKKSSRKTVQQGTGFLADLAKDWETEAHQAEQFGVRVVIVRFGIILAKDGGALPAMMKPLKLGVGGKLGDGKQWMSWVGLEDVVAIIRRALQDDSMAGPFNVVAPEPIRNADFTKVLAQVLHRPAIFAAPKFALRLAMGEMADEALLSSQRAIPAALQQHGYKFLHTDLRSTLQSIVK